MKSSKPGKNEFFDINKLPSGEGCLVFPLSMSRLDTGQVPARISRDLEIFLNKVSYPSVGVNFIYTDFLYLNSNEKANVLKNKFSQMIHNHSNALKNLIYKKRYYFQIQHAFSYITWGQLYLFAKTFQDDFKKLKEIYDKDDMFKKYVKNDAFFTKKRLTKNQLNFFLEEYLFAYYIIKGKIRFPNEFIQGKDKWYLLCYPGESTKGLIYLTQKNFFKLPKIQPYEGQYNLETKKFIDFHNVDLETYSVK